MITLQVISFWPPTTWLPDSWIDPKGLSPHRFPWFLVHFFSVWFGVLEVHSENGDHFSSRPNSTLNIESQLHVHWPLWGLRATDLSWSACVYHCVPNVQSETSSLPNMSWQGRWWNQNHLISNMVYKWPLGQQVKADLCISEAPGGCDGSLQGWYHAEMCGFHFCVPQLWAGLLNITLWGLADTAAVSLVVS